MKIGELSRVTGVSIPTIRLYEREGLIGPASRTEGRFRVFSIEHMHRLAFIKRARRLGFALDDVKAMLTVSDSISSDGALSTIQKLRTGIATRQRDLKALDQRLSLILVGEVSPHDLELTFDEVTSSA